MPAKRILLLDGPGLTAHRWNGGRIKVEGEFGNDPAGLEALGAYLRKNRSSLFYLLADLAEEGFQLEDLPYVQGSDRTALLARRLGQYYYNTPLSVAIPLGRAASGRRDEKMLFAALTRTESFTPWLDTLRESEALLAGVYSVPLVLATCAPQLLGQSGPVLFVSLTRGGVRQTFFDQGKLHFSRLSQLATHSLDEIGRTSSADSAKIFQYLVAQRQVPRGVPLRTLVLAHAGEMPALQEFCRNTSELRFEFLDLAATAQQMGLKELPADSSADDLFMHCLATKTPAQQFAPAGDRRFYKLWQIRFALTSTAWILLAACMLFAGKTGYDLYELRNSIEATKALTLADTRRYKAVLEGLPNIGVSADNLRALMNRVETLQARAPAIEPLLQHLSLALNDTPKVEITRLTWKISDRPDVGQKAGEEDKRGGGGTARNWAVIEIQAQLPAGLATDQRAQIELIDNFATRLRDAKTEVRVLSRPFDIESDKTLRSTGERSETQLADAPKFSLRLARLM
jgi:hypothetical protein